MQTDYPEPQETIVRLDVPVGYREDERLDHYVTRFLPNVTRTRVQKGIREGHVRVNDRVVERPSFRVSAGDHIACTLMKPPPIEARPEPIPLDVLYEDAHLLVVNKPAGLVVHPAYGHRSGTLVNALLHHVGARVLTVEDLEEEGDEDVGLSMVNAGPDSAEGIDVRPGIVHRLDKDTSGVMVVAKDDVTHTGLAHQFIERTIRRRYLALVWGQPVPAEGRIETHLGRDPRERKRMAVVSETRGKRAVTHFETVRAYEDASLLRVRLETGRTHQIRVHAAHIGHPIFGDPVYGGRRLPGRIRTQRTRSFWTRLLGSFERQALHAASLGFRHPRTGEELDFEAPLPDDMQWVIDALDAESM